MFIPQLDFLYFFAVIISAMGRENAEAYVADLSRSGRN